jgi:hypothetical protein
MVPTMFDIFSIFPVSNFFLVIEFRKNYENKKIGGEIGRLGWKIGQPHQKNPFLSFIEYFFIYLDKYLEIYFNIVILYYLIYYWISFVIYSN